MGLQLKIGGRFCDLDNDNNNLSIDFAIYDGKTLSNIKSSTTNRNIKIPATNHNTVILGFYGELSQDAIPAQFEFPCEMYADGYLLVKGKGYLQKANYGLVGSDYQLKVATYEILIIGENADCFTDMRELYLRDCMTEPTHTQSPTLMNDGLEADYDSGDKYGYLPIQYTATAKPNQYSVGELTPFYFGLSLVEDIFKKVGYTVDSNFFYSNGFKRLAFPLYPVQKYPPEFSNDYLNITATISATVPYPDWEVLAFPFDTQSQIPPVGNPYSVISYEYTVPYKGFYRMQGFFKLEWDSLGTNVFFAIIPFKNFAPVSPPPYGTYKENIATGDILEFDTVVFCEFGDILTINTGLSVGTGISVKESYFKITGEALYTYGRTDNFVNLAYLTRNWKALDFIKGITGMFNLAWQANAITKIVRCEPKDDYILTYRELGTGSIAAGFYQQTVDDFTSRLAINQPADLTNRTDAAISFILSLKEDSNDLYIKQANAAVVNDFKAGCSWYNPPALKANKDIDVIENPFFAPTMHRRAADLSQPNPITNQEVIVQIPILFADGQNTFEELTFNFQPRLLYYRKYGSTVNDGYWNYDDGSGGGASSNKYYPCFAVNGLDVTGLDWNLHYGSELNAANTIGKGLAERYYLRQAARERLGNTLKVFAYFDTIQIQNLDFAKKIRIAQGIFILQSLNNYLPTNPSAPCQIELQQDSLNPTNYFQTGQPTTLNIAQ
jgi:hypothetical protein